MATFNIVAQTVQWTGVAGSQQQTPGKIVLNSRRLEVRISVSATLLAGESYYLGYIQVCTANNQRNFYGANVEQRWEFSNLPVSDSAAAEERPWYGIDSEPKIGGFRRVKLVGPLNNSVQTVNMTDDFAPGVAKLDTLSNGVAGPNRLNRVIRDQSFRLWLAAIPTNKVNQLADYQRLFELDWRYQLDYNVNWVGGNANVVVVQDNPTHTIHVGNAMHPIPMAALLQSIANDSQQLNYYSNNVQQHVIVARTG
jgi:hypothetical protein